MSEISWSAAFSLGVAEIDSDHRTSVLLLAALAQASDEDTDRHFKAFVDHLKDHFAREEALMADAGFAMGAYAYHQAEHRRVLKMLAELDGVDARQKRRSARFHIWTWFQQHLATMDTVTAEAVREARVAVPSL